MRVLILDDEKVRHDAFAARYSGHDVWHVYTYEGARKALLARRYDLVHLDHDIGDPRPESDGLYGSGKGGEWTGQDVAKLVVALPPEMRPDSVCVHSWNPDGARAIVRIIGQARIPYTREPFSVRP